MSEETATFEALGLSAGLLNAVRDAGYEVPTPIQDKAIPVVLLGRDALGCAQTGTGKTASYTLPIIDILDAGTAKARMPRTLILAPTRELAQQIAGNFETYGKYHKLAHALLIGGAPFLEQERALVRGPDVLIATPGRLLDFVERGKLMLGGIKILVIDEADRMLDMGFIPDVERIVSLLPRIRQTLLFSATLGPEIRRLADAFLINPKEIRVSPPASVAQTVSDTLVRVSPRAKADVLRKLIAKEDVQSALIFCNRKRDISGLRESLRRHGHNVAELHGDLPQYRRTETLDAFRRGEISLLVCSDVAGRGLDIDKVSHVFNFDVPINAEDYVHRIGRTGRAGKEGRAITLTTAEDGKLVDAIVRLIGRPIPTVSADGIAAESGKQADTDATAKPAPSESEPRKPKTRRGGRAARSKDQDARAKDDRSGRGGKRERSGEGADKPEVGMGDHVPDFLNAPVRVRKRRRTES